MAGLRQNQPPGRSQGAEAEAAAFVWRGCPGHALARPAVSGNTRAARKASGPQLLPAHRLGASRTIPRNLWQKNPPPALPCTRGHQDQERSPVTWSAGPRDRDLCSQRSPRRSVPSCPWKHVPFPRRSHPADREKAAALTMERASRVCWSSGSGSREICTHSGTFTVPPSRSAITTSSWKQQDRHEMRPGSDPPHHLPLGDGD